MFKQLLYGLLILKCIYWLFSYDVLFGSNSIFFSSPYPVRGMSDLAFLLYSQTSPVMAYYFIFTILGFSLIQLFTSRLYFVLDFILWFLVVNLHNKIYSSLTGGDYLLNQFLLFNCIIASRFNETENRSGQLKIFMHNFGVLGIIIQVSLVYFLSGIIKLSNAEWLSGKALAMISQVRHFSMYSFPAGLNLPQSMFIFLNYAVLFYQCTFPFLVWMKPIKKPFIVIGILMHLYIAFVMGLPGFGFVMIISYVFFWPLSSKRSVTNSTNLL